MAINIRAKRLQAPATNIAQDFEITSFGTPQACLVFSGIAGDVSDVAPIQNSIGFSDGTNDVCASTVYEDAVLKENAAGGSKCDAAAVVEILDNLGNVDRSATASFATDKVTLTWAGSDLTLRPWTIVVLINGINGAAAGALTPGDGTDTTATATASGLGITPKVIFGVQGRNNVIDATAAHKSMSFGFAYDNGTGYDQHCHAWNHRSELITLHSIARNDYISVDYGTSSPSGYQSITDMTSGAFTSTSSAASGGADVDLLYLALDFDEDAAVFESVVPTTNVDFVPYTGGSFTPTAAIMIPTFVTSSNSQDTGAGAGFFGQYVVTESEQECIAYCDEDNAATNSNTSGSTESQLFIQTHTAGTNDFEGHETLPTFASGSITYAAANVTEGSQASKVYGIAFSSASVVNTSIIVPTGPSR